MNQPGGNLKPLFDITPLRDSLAEGATVITSNLRLARKIRDAWNLDNADSGRHAWPAAAVLPVDAWLQACWLDLVDGAFAPALTGAVATRLQEALLWERAIAEDSQRPADARPENFADLARRGWSLLRLWQVDEKRLAGFDHNGARHLLRWGCSLDRLMADHGLIDDATRTAIVRQGFEEGALPRLDRLLLAGFQTLPPLLRATFESATEDLTFLPPPNRRGSKRVIEADDIDNELAAAADWAHRLARDNPGSRIGVVVPRLTSLHKAVERVFRHQFQPDACLPGSPYRPAAFNISVGTALADTPVVTDALALLQLLVDPLTVDHLCRLLDSPFWGDADREGDIRCRCHAALRDLGLHELSSGRFRRILERIEADSGPPGAAEPLSQRLVRVATLGRSNRGRRNFGQWSDLFGQVLEALGWPGRRSPDSLEYQQIEAWREIDEQFRQLDRLQGTASVNEAIKWLTRLARDTIFHPQGEDSPVQILGTLEATGLSFDHLWLMNADNRQWPEAVAPHPLLPVALQRQMEMPRSSPERELALSRALFELFAASADEVIFSYARQEGDIGIQPSALLASTPREHRPGSADHPWLGTIAGASALEVASDHRGPPLHLEESDIRGGSRLLADQAGCPFNAFAQWRLGAEPLGEPVSGLGPRLRGVLVHDSLERLWRQLGDHAGLTALDETACSRVVASAARDAMEGLFTGPGELRRSDFGERLLELETGRIEALLLQWLEIERERPPFTVAATEQSLPLEIDGLALRLRLDRIDRLDSGGAAIIDYKTGNTRIRALAGERLLEPQLPLYALAAQESPVAVAYAGVNRTGPGFSGVASDDALLPGCKSLDAMGLPAAWPETLAQWRGQLALLIAEIRRGEAGVAFYNREAATYGGHMEPLNRRAGSADLDALKKRLAAPGEKP